MVRKIAFLFCAVALVLVANVRPVSAAQVYEDTISSTYLQYARDLIPNSKFNDDYLFFRSGQYEYTLLMGDLDYESGTFKNSGSLVSYVFTVGSGYNSSYTFEQDSVGTFTLTPNNKMVYSNLGGYPQLVERGSNYEVLQTIFMCIVGLCIVIRSIFTVNSKR